MASEKRPSFQFYPLDWLGDARVRAMTPEARGAYIDLLCLCWREGTLPLDLAVLARLVGVSRARFERHLWPQLAPCFTWTEEGYTQKRIEHEREKQSRFHEQKSRAGTLGNIARWSQNHRKDIADASQRDGSAIADPIAKHRSSSSSSLYTEGSTKNVAPSVCTDARARDRTTVAEPSLDARGEHLWEHWRQLLRETRKLHAPLLPKSGDWPKLAEALLLMPDDTELHARLTRFMHLPAEQLKSLNVKAITLGYFVMALPQLTETPDANDAAITAWLTEGKLKHDAH